MENFILPERIANAIMMNKSFKGQYLLVEGPKDSKFFSKFIDHSLVSIKESFGFRNVMRVFEILTEREFLRKIGVIDSDFSEIIGQKNQIHGIFHTDHHDLEIMMANSSALHCLFTTYSSISKVVTFEANCKKSIREVIFQLGKEIAFLKLANRIHNLGLVFKPKTIDGNQLKYKDFIDESTLNFRGLDSLIETVVNYSRSKSPNMQTTNFIKEKFIETSSIEYDLNHLVNGHDISNILFILLKKVLRSSNRMLNDFNSIEDSLILAYEYDEFKRTSLFRNINEYALSNGIIFFKN